MLLKHAALFMTSLALCLMIVVSAGAQTADEDRQAVTADQQALDEAYHKLEEDRKTGNVAGMEIDQDDITTAEQDFRTDEQRTIEDDQKVVVEDRQTLERLSQQLQLDQMKNTGDVTADEKNIQIAQQKLQIDKKQTVADDGLEISRDQQALYTENQQLQQDLRENIGAVPLDEANLKQTTQVLQTAQLKFQIDRNNQSSPP